MVLPHYLNDIYLVYLNKTYVNWHQVDGKWQATLGIGKWVLWAWDFAIYLTLPVLALVFYGGKGWVSWNALDIKTTHLARNFAFGMALFAGIWGVAFFKALYLNPWLNKLLPRFGYPAFFYKPEDGLVVYALMAIYVGLAAGIAHLGWQVRRLDVDHAAMCLRLFKSNRDFGLIVLLAIVAGQLGS